MNNKSVEDAAIAFVLDYERRAGRAAHDVRHSGAAGDVDSTDRVIEVKAYGNSARGDFLWLEARQYNEARHNRNFWVYVVDNIRQGDPRQFGIVALGGAELATLLNKAKEQRTYTVTLPVKVYDELRQE